MKQLIYEVRKEGMISVSSKTEAKSIQVDAAFNDFNFGIKKHGWNWLVIDEDI